MKKITTDTETIYIDIDELYGGWMATTEGEPTCLNMLEEAGAEEEIGALSPLSTSILPRTLPLRTDIMLASGLKYGAHFEIERRRKNGRCKYTNQRNGTL